MPDSVIKPKVLSDALIGVVDRIRSLIHPALGTRSYRVAIVKRTWSGGRRGVGTEARDITWIEPNPLVTRATKDRMGPAGRESAGQVILTEVSLSYTEGELDPQPGGGVEVAYVIVDNHGQRQKPKWHVLAASPVPRRGDKPGDRTDWYIVLNETSDVGDLDDVDSP